MNRRDFLKISAASAAGLFLSGLGGAFDPDPALAAAPALTTKPNIVLILADDLGYAGLSCQGGDIPTPNIDTLARDGVRATAGYVTCSLCAPTRAGLLTGRYQQRFGFEFNPGPQEEDTFGLPLDQRTIAEYLKAAGYTTGMFGKWHLGYQAGQRPPERGFDAFYGFLGGAHAYYPEKRRKGSQVKNPVMRGLSEEVTFDYLTRALASEAAAFIDRYKTRPFFLYLPLNAVHNPLQAPPETLERFKSIADETRRTHAAMLTELDDAVGVVLERLRRHGLQNNTLVVFLSDNGGPTQSTTASNAPFSGQKATFYEGGIRVPFLLRWPGHVPAGKVYGQPLSSLDLLPTILAAAGVTPPASAGLDGVDLLPYLSDQRSGAPHSDLFWRMGDAWAVQSSGWKLVRAERKGGAAQLFNLAVDPGEQTDLYKKQPRKARELQTKYNAWSDQMVDPLRQRQKP